MTASTGGIAERIRELRTVLGLTQKQFGDRVGIKRNTIATYEMGRNAPIDSVFELICREYGVSRIWLETGAGSMFESGPPDPLEYLTARYKITPGMQELIREILALTPAQQDIVINFMERVTDNIKAKRKPIVPTPPVDLTDDDLHAVLQQQLDEEKKAAGKSEGFPRTG